MHCAVIRMKRLMPANPHAHWVFGDSSYWIEARLLRNAGTELRIPVMFIKELDF